MDRGYTGTDRNPVTEEEEKTEQETSEGRTDRTGEQQLECLFLPVFGHSFHGLAPTDPLLAMLALMSCSEDLTCDPSLTMVPSCQKLLFSSQLSGLAKSHARALRQGTQPEGPQAHS
ncbi:unnamed protein product [Gadus morhua 'NCC']